MRLISQEELQHRHAMHQLYTEEANKRAMAKHRLEHPEDVQVEHRFYA
jgi:hypothetical protein